MINLEVPKKHKPLIGQAHQVAMNLLRPNSRKYDTREHEYPVELDMLAARGQRGRHGGPPLSLADDAPADAPCDEGHVDVRHVRDVVVGDRGHVDVNDRRAAARRSAVLCHWPSSSR